MEGFKNARFASARKVRRKGTQLKRAQKGDGEKRKKKSESRFFTDGIQPRFKRTNGEKSDH